MLLDRYESYFFNANFREAASSAGWEAYRGELILEEGEIADAQGRRKPPQAVMKQAIALGSGNDLKFLAGSLDDLKDFSALLEKWGADFKADSVVVLFTVNIDDPFVYTVNETRVVFIPMVQGMVWNELGDMVGLDKSDFKGQGAADKVVTLYGELKSHKFKYPEAQLSEIKTNSNKRENHGAI